MSKNLTFFIPYHTGYAHAELVLSFASYTDVHLFVYKWNPSLQRIKEYFSNKNQIHFHEFSIDNILSELTNEKHRKVVVILTASTNYLFGRLQLNLFNIIQQYVSTLIDIYAVGHCMYGCQSCVYSSTHSLPITFTNYIRTKSQKLLFENDFQIVICPSYSFENDPCSFLSNNDIIEYILTLKYSHIIKLHPLAYDDIENTEHPFLSLTNLERRNVIKLYQQSKNLLINQEINILKLIEHARIIICDSNSSIPFETLYFQDKKYLFVYKPIIENSDEDDDDREKFFHTFSNVDELKNLIENYFNNQLECKTENGHKFFLEKYSEPNGNEIEQLSIVRKWIKTDNQEINNFDPNVIKQAISDEFKSISSPMTLYTLGDHTVAQVEEIFFSNEENLFDTMQNNINEL